MEHLPNTYNEFIGMLLDNTARYRECQCCNKPFVNRTHTQAGWRETQISGFCEDCFDEITQEEDN